MSWVQILIGAIAIAREIVKYLQSREENKALVKVQINEFKRAMRRARKEGNTEDVEKLLSNIGLNRRLSDKKE